jgi:hypothetical protein
MLLGESGINGMSEFNLIEVTPFILENSTMVMAAVSVLKYDFPI